jgi:hypothetical protein
MANAELVLLNTSRTLLALENLDTVDIVTDEAARGRQAQLCLEKGCAVFVEKPLATNREGAEAVAVLAERTELPVVVGNILALRRSLRPVTARARGWQIRARSHGQRKAQLLTRMVHWFWGTGASSLRIHDPRSRSRALVSACPDQAGVRPNLLDGLQYERG